MKKCASIVLSIALILALAAPDTMAAAKFRWKSTNIAPAGQVYTKLFYQLADMIKEATKGEIEVVHHPAGELPFKGTDYLKVTSKGMVELSEVVAGFVFGEVPLMAMPDFPYLPLNKAEYEKYYEVILPYIFEELENRGVVPIAWVRYGPRQIAHRKPTFSLDDMKGQKIRTSAALQDAYIKQWEGVPTFVLWAEVYPAAQRGIVDGIMTATAAIETSKVYEVCPYLFKIDGPMTHSFICVNKKSWDNLSKETQQIVRKTAEEWHYVWDKKIIDEDDLILLQMLNKDQIKTIAKLPQEERIKTRERMLPVLEQYVKKNIQPKGPEIFAKALKVLNLE